jgi:four helix bundle protein
MDLVDQVYAASAKWPASEFYGLVAQIRRAAVSIPANIAEGHGRNGRREYVYHLGIARGSLCEVETMVMVAARQHYGDGEQARCILSTSTEVGKLLRALLRALGPQ